MSASALLPVSFEEQPLRKTAKIVYGKYGFFIDKALMFAKGSNTQSGVTPRPRQLQRITQKA